MLGASAATRAAELASGEAPPFTLPDLDGVPFSLDRMRGRKTLVVAFASWCGCAYELPGWQALHDELAGDGFGVVAVAVDEDPEAVRPFTDGIDLPVLIDRDRLFAERYGLTNVPTVVWIDEESRLVRRPDVAFGTDQFIEFHQVDSSPHHEALRRWVRDDQPPATGDTPGWAPSEAEQAAHLHYRLALHLWRDGRRDAADAPLRPGRRAGPAGLHRPPGPAPAAGQGPVPRRGVPPAVGRVGRGGTPLLRPPDRIAALRCPTPSGPGPRPRWPRRPGRTTPRPARRG